MTSDKLYDISQVHRVVLLIVPSPRYQDWMCGMKVAVVQVRELWIIVLLVQFSTAVKEWNWQLLLLLLLRRKSACKTFVGSSLEECIAVARCRRSILGCGEKSPLFCLVERVRRSTFERRRRASRSFMLSIAFSLRWPPIAAPRRCEDTLDAGRQTSRTDWEGGIAFEMSLAAFNTSEG